MKLIAVSVLLALCLGAIAVLALTAPGELRGLRVASAIVLAGPTIGWYATQRARLTGRQSETTSQRVKRVLQSSLVVIARERMYPADVLELSFHVWTISTLYHRLMPRGWRRRYLSDARGRQHFMRPRVHRLAMFRFEHQYATGVSFRGGIGLVGRVIARDDPHRDVVLLTLDRGPLLTDIEGGDGGAMLGGDEGGERPNDQRPNACSGTGGASCGG